MREGINSRKPVPALHNMCLLWLARVLISYVPLDLRVIVIEIKSPLH